MVKADVALAVLVLLALGIRGGDPEQGLAVAPARHVRIFVLELEAEEAEHLAVEVLRAREVADAEHEVIDADDAGHGGLPRARLPAAAHAGAAGGRAWTGAVGLGFALRAHLVEVRLARRLALRALAPGAIGQALVVERDPHLVELGLV